MGGARGLALTAAFLAAAAAITLVVLRPPRPAPAPAPAPRAGVAVASISWRAWGRAVQEQAQREGKPVLLWLDAWGSHAAAEMERSDFGDPGVAAFITARTVPIRVDVEDRPDLAEVYELAAQAIGSRAGLPLLLWLLPDGRPFFATGYLAPEQLAHTLQDLEAEWQRKRPALEKYAAGAAQATLEALHPPPSDYILTEPLLTGAALDIAGAYDRKYGGFGGTPKALPAARLDFLLRVQERSPDPAVRTAIAGTLDTLARSPVCDQLGGGFHHGATDDRWLAPRFEKRLAENAALALVYTRAYQVLDEPAYLEVAKRTLDFMLRDLRAPGGALYAGLAADTADGPGAAYRWTRGQVETALADGADRRRFWSAFTLAPQAGDGALYRPAGGAAASGSADEDATLARIGETLLAVRRRRPQPRVDKRILLGANGTAIAALVLGGKATGDLRYRAAARAVAEAVLPLVATGEAMGTGARPRAPALDDYAPLAIGLSELARTRRRRHWRQREQALLDAAMRDLWDEAASEFRRAAADAPWPGAIARGERDSAAPSPAGQLLEALLRDASAAPEERGVVEAQRARRALRRLAVRATVAPADYAGILSAIDTALALAPELPPDAPPDAGTAPESGERAISSGNR